LATASNIVLPVIGRIGRAGFVSERLEREAAAGSSSQVDLNSRYLDFRIGDLSGGNQQKAMLARAMQTGAKILLLYDPTRGVDVGTKQSIYAAIRSFAESGGALRDDSPSSFMRARIVTLAAFLGGSLTPAA